MKITTDEQYNKIPNGTQLNLVLTGTHYSTDNICYLVVKDDNCLCLDSEYWDWNERDMPGFEFKLETIMEGKAKFNPNLVKKNTDKHLKGYIYDSLVFRHQVALERGLPLRVEEYIGKGLSKQEARNKAQIKNNDDLCRFIRVLEEAMGEHD